MVFFVFCFMPNSRGAALVVESALQPAYVWVQENLETPLHEAVQEAKKVIKETTGVQLAKAPADRRKSSKAE